MTDLAEVLSLLLTIPTLILCIWVIKLYAKPAIDAGRDLVRGEIPPRTQLLVLGICLGFAGSFVDNVYWGLAWGAESIGHPARDWLFENGVWSNLPFRQGTGILAGLCHLLAAKRSRDA